MSYLYTPIVKVRSNMHGALDKCMSPTLKFHPVFWHTRCNIDIKRKSERKSTSVRTDTNTYPFDQQIVLAVSVIQRPFGF